MGRADWNSWDARALCVCVNGDAITEPGPRGERITDADFILLINANGDPVTFTVPASFGSAGVAWELLVDTGLAASADAGAAEADGSEARPGRLGSTVGWGGSVLNLEVAARSIVVLRGTKPNGG